MHSIQRTTLWKRLPGNWDVLNFSRVYSSDNVYGIPTIGKEDTQVPSDLLAWGSRPKMLEGSASDNVAIHFFLDDFRFESLWHTPARNLDAIKLRNVVLSPDFSLWSDMPQAMQAWNVYRNRWLGCYWQEQGVHVIPTISWSDASSYDFCFEGVEKGSMVAISTVGVIRQKSAYDLFRSGFDKMREVIEPSVILCYGSLSPLGTQASHIIEYPTRWQQIRGARKTYGR